MGTRECVGVCVCVRARVCVRALVLPRGLTVLLRPAWSVSTCLFHWTMVWLSPLLVIYHILHSLQCAKSTHLSYVYSLSTSH